MADIAELLPGPADNIELALAAGMSDELPIPYAVLLDPYECPEAMLPWLAAQYALDLWFDDWPIDRKREAVAQAAGRSPDYPGEELAATKTTRGGAIRYLALVDGEIVDAVAFPAHAFADDAFCDDAIIDHPPWLATYLVKVETEEPHAAIVDGAFADEDFGGETITDPYDRCLAALRVAKATHTELRVDFQTYRVITAGDGLTAGGGYSAGQYLPRIRL